MNMATYTPATIAKALSAFGISTIGAAISAAHGADLATLDFGSWVGAIGAGLVAGGAVFAVPNKSHEPEVSPADQIVAALPVVVAAQAQAAADIDKIKQAAADALGQVPIVGPLATQVIAAVR